MVVPGAVVGTGNVVFAGGVVRGGATVVGIGTTNVVVLDVVVVAFGSLLLNEGNDSLWVYSSGCLPSSPQTYTRSPLLTSDGKNLAMF